AHASRVSTADPRAHHRHSRVRGIGGGGERMTTPVAASADLLATIVAATKRIVAVREASESFDALAHRAESRAVRPGAFRSALSRTHRFNIIAECKRRSPSRGVL